MRKLPAIPAKVLIQYLHEHGFELTRQKGSHKFFRHTDGRTATVPEHRGEDLGKGILLKILKDIDVSKEEFIAWHLE